MKSRRVRILVYNGWYLIGHVDRDAPLVQELRDRGYEVDYVLGAGKAATRGFGHPKSAGGVGRLARIPSTYCSSMLHLERLISRSDVVLLGMTKGTEAIAEIAKAHGKLVGHFDHTCNYEFRCSPHADFYAVRGSYFKDLLVEVSPQIDPSKVTVIGSLQLDRAMWPEVRDQSRDQFCQEYGLDPGRKIALFLPTGPQNMDDWYQREYVNICEVVRADPRFALAIKPHPTDYARRKAGRLGWKHSWEALTPWATVIRPEHVYQSFHHCELTITVASAVAFELALFEKPLVLVDVDKWPTYIELFENENAPYLKRHFPYPVPSWVGLACSLEELGDVLATGRYLVKDSGRYEEHVATYCYKNDGLAYRRLADLVDDVDAERLGRRRLALPGGWFVRAGVRRVQRRCQRLSRSWR